MKIVAVVLGVLALAGTLILVIAGASTGPDRSNAMGPLAFLLCIVAVVAMIVLGVTLGGRNNPRRAPHTQAQTSVASAVEPAPRPEQPVTEQPVPRQEQLALEETDTPGDPT
jgi:hypothetical protein